MPTPSGISPTCATSTATPASTRHPPKSQGIYLILFSPFTSRAVASRWWRGGGARVRPRSGALKTAKIKPAEASSSANKRRTRVRLPLKRVQKHLSARVRTAIQKDAHNYSQQKHNRSGFRGSRPSSEFGDPRERSLFCWVGGGPVFAVLAEGMVSHG
ncbi:hypothetical protein BDZ85DRAFT_21269 [Elsinoe ampelina]|uniref:Uncharacterized protein n=1 Tax=Elsinoe ampelina TaxID=302913 RepID=A0A6A6G5M6_9PEZI|nr:hypothetical protein BDZ85DRAFT_21269 [Elsinoe ampelina]